MIIAAAICPCPPLLATELTGQAEVLPELRAACAAAVAKLAATAPDVLVVIGPDERTASWTPDGRLDAAAYAPGAGRAGSGPGGSFGSAGTARSAGSFGSAGPGGSFGPAGPAASAGTAGTADPAGSAGSLGPVRRRTGVPVTAPLPLSLGIGAQLLDEAGYQGPRALHGIAADASSAECLRLGARMAARAPRVALLAMGDGSARRSVAAPGYLDERAAPFDAEVERAVRDGDLRALAALDPELAAELMAGGRPAWQVLAGALSARPGRPGTEILYREAPLGVAYLVAVLIPQP